MVAEKYPNYYVLQDGFEGSARLVMMSRPPAELRYGYAVKVQGVLGTLHNGERCLDQSIASGLSGRRAVVMAVPEPSSMLALVAGMGAVGAAYRRRKAEHYAFSWVQSRGSRYVSVIKQLDFKWF